MGKLSIIRHTHSAIFKEIPETFSATRYHSLIVDRSSLPECLEITAETSDGTIMGYRIKVAQFMGFNFIQKVLLPNMDTLCYQIPLK